MRNYFSVTIFIHTASGSYCGATAGLPWLTFHPLFLPNCLSGLATRNLHAVQSMSGGGSTQANVWDVEMWGRI